MLTIEIAYARSDQQFLLTLAIEPGSNIQQAIQCSGILEQCPEIDLSIYKVGIFSKKANLETLLKQQDRIEIYRPLLINPMQARRLRARQK